MLKFSNVEKTFYLGEDSWQMGPFSLEIQPREYLAIMGKSGSGKSTLLHLAAGMLKPDSGEIMFENKKINSFSEKEMGIYRNKHIGFVFQDFYLMDEFSLLENVAMPLFIRNVKRKKAIQVAMESIEHVGLSGKEKNRPSQLSGGQRQRAAIARAIVGDPKMILADEPTGNLDSATGNEIIELLIRLNQEKKITLLLATHDEKLAEKADRKVWTSDGKVFEKE